MCNKDKLLGSWSYSIGQLFLVLFFCSLLPLRAYSSDWGVKVKATFIPQNSSTDQKRRVKIVVSVGTRYSLRTRVYARSGVGKCFYSWFLRPNNELVHSWSDMDTAWIEWIQTTPASPMVFYWDCSDNTVFDNQSDAPEPFPKCTVEVFVEHQGLGVGFPDRGRIGKTVVSIDGPEAIGKKVK